MTKPYKLLKRWNTTYFPWVQDNPWQIVGEFDTMEECEVFLDTLLPTHVYTYKIEEPEPNALP